MNKKYIPNIKVLFSKIKNFEFKKILNIFNNNKTILVFTIIGLVVLNYLSLKYFVRLDTTDSQNFSISQTTKDIISELENDVTIEVYFSDNIPPNLTEARQNVLDLLEEYAKTSNGKIILDLKDPQSSDFETNAQTKGIQQIQFSEYGQDKFSVAQGYLGVAFVNDSATEVIPVVASIDNLEYETTSRILKLTASDDKKKIGFFSKFPAPESPESESAVPIQEQSILSTLTTIEEILGRQYGVEEIDLSSGKPINVEEFPVVVVVAPSAPLGDRDKFELDQYVMKGGSLLVLEDLLKLEMNAPVLSKTESNLNTFLEHYGITVETKVLLDESFTPIISGFDQIAYPYWVLATDDGINREIPPLNTLQASTFLWTNPITKNEKENLDYTELITTTNLAWEESGEVINIDFKEFSPSDQKKYTISYLVEGQIDSAFKDKDIPALTDTTKSDERTEEDQKIDSGESLRLVVFGDSDFISDSFINANEQNPVLFLNLIDWMANSNDLSSIRAKGVTTRPLEALDNEDKNIYKAVNSASIPVIVTLAGITYLRRRKNSPSKI
ncbi:GldG family protein [Candidatus Dojkabacteria bacterium]|uniref:GldG family protein n=1 Tax=Candidatus Dojkabacteria bacterium TaxID=2099670 RepID=A0A955L0S4_9BACT|nr:GldG family protein [Candidatus Dojkabacteria bacterium]